MDLSSILDILNYENYIVTNNISYIWYTPEIIHNTYLYVFPSDILNIIKKYIHIVRDNDLSKCLLCGNSERNMCYHSIHYAYDIICLYNCNHLVVNRIILPSLYNKICNEAKFINTYTYNGTLTHVNSHCISLDICPNCQFNMLYKDNELIITIRYGCINHRFDYNKYNIST